MSHEHRYQAELQWTGAVQGPTSSYEAYSRDYLVTIAGKPPLKGSADPIFRGDSSRFNPKEMLVAALMSCHLLEYLYLCSRAGIAVVSYTDTATGTMAMRDGKVRFVEVVLAPTVVVSSESDPIRASELHETAHAGCYIANSVAFPVRNAPTVRVVEPPSTWE